jgi:hypothetical protein
MQSEIIAMMVPLDSLSATMLVRRADGQIDFARIDARLAAASRVASRWLRKDRSTSVPSLGVRGKDSLVLV